MLTIFPVQNPPCGMNVPDTVRMASQKYIPNMTPVYAVLMLDSTLKNWILGLGWQSALFQNEPGYVPSIYSAYAELMLYSCGLRSGVIDIYYNTYKGFAYVLHVPYMC